MSASSSASTHRSRREYSTTSSDYRSSSSPEPAEEEPRFMTFEARLQASRMFFIASPPVPNPWSNRHLTEVSFRKYQQLCLRGFLVQGMLVLDDPGFAEARSIVENVGWMYTVLHVRPFCPRVVRECISNLYGSDAGVYIRGCRLDFDPVVINQLFMTPIVEQPHTWEDGDLSQAIAFLTGGRCTHWEPFSLTQLLPQYLCLYKLCELNFASKKASSFSLRVCKRKADRLWSTGLWPDHRNVSSVWCGQENCSPQLDLSDSQSSKGHFGSSRWWTPNWSAAKC